MTKRFCAFLCSGDDESSSELLSFFNSSSRPVYILVTLCGREKCLLRRTDDATDDATAAAELMELRSYL